MTTFVMMMMMMMMGNPQSMGKPHRSLDAFGPSPMARASLALTLALAPVLAIGLVGLVDLALVLSIGLKIGLPS